MAQGASFTARARTDARDWLMEADEPLAGLQLRSGGELPGVIASPALLELVRKSRVSGLRLARAIRARDDAEEVTAWVEVTPDEGGDGCRIGVSNWQAAPLPQEDPAEAAARRLAIVRQLAELSARLGTAQELLAVDATAVDLAPLLARMRNGLGSPWTDFVGLEGSPQQQPLHWRLLDEARVHVDGSQREWTAHLIPLGVPEPSSAGFELHLVADQPLDRPDAANARAKPTFSTAIGREIAPV